MPSVKAEPRTLPCCKVSFTPVTKASQKTLRMMVYGLAIGVIVLLVACGSVERRMLFYPTHHDDDGGLKKWMGSGETIGLAREVAAPKNVWLLMHGNAGQAADRTYALPSFVEEDSVFILEYPGYGRRPGKPSKASFNAAAEQAFGELRKAFPNTPVCVAGESIGTGPACHLATMERPPDKIVLVTPFDSLEAVARDHFPRWMVGILLRQRWDNVAALSNYKGRVHIFAAEDDTIIPPEHARTLAKATTNSTLTIIRGGHNDWSMPGEVKIRN